MAKTGGRKKGTPNKRTQEVIDRLEGLNCNPIEGMALIAKQAMGENDLRLAGQMYKELAQYIAPKRKSVEIESPTDEKPVEELTDEELNELLHQAKNLIETTGSQDETRR